MIEKERKGISCFMFEQNNTKKPQKIEFNNKEEGFFLFFL